MKKKMNKGFMLVETLIVTTFVAGILVFLFIQFTNLSENYDDSYHYNTVEGLYALKNIKNYIESDTSALNFIEEQINQNSYTNIINCDLFTEKNYCIKLFELENIKKIYITKNYFEENLFFDTDEGFKNFVSKINSQGQEKYRILAEFTNSTYATIRFGD